MSAHPVAMMLAKLGRNQAEQAAAIAALQQGAERLARDFAELERVLAELKHRTEGDGR